MWTGIFENRNRKISSLVKLGSCLGRSLRENVELFSVDEDVAIYLTESDKVIRGTVTVNDNTCRLDDIEVEDADLFKDNEKFTQFVEKQVGDFVHNIFENDYIKAKGGLQKVLNLWESGLKFNKVTQRLEEKAEKFNQSNKILGTEEFSKLMEIAPQLSDFLQKNKDKIQNISEIRNAIKLSNTVATAFDWPKITIEQLAENKSYQLKDSHASTIYDMVCRQETVKRELLEAKRNFSNIWATNPKFGNLVEHLYGEDNEEFLASLAEVIVEIPYLAFASKKQIAETIDNSLGLAEDSPIPSKDIKKFASKIFELKKPVKLSLIRMLNEKYGINIQNLKEPPSFKNLLNTQVVVFETMQRISPKQSIQKQVLSEVVTMLKTKNGIESIDVNDFLHKTFEDAGYTDILEENNLLNYLDFDRVANDLGQIGDILRMLKAKAGDEGGGMGGEMQPGMEQGGGQEGAPGMPPDMGVQGQEGESMPVPGGGAPQMGQEEPLDAANEMGDEDVEAGLGGMDAEEAAMGAEEEFGAEAGQGEMPLEPGLDPGMEEPGSEGEQMAKPGMGDEEMMGGAEPGMEEFGDEMEGEMGEEEVAPEEVDKEEIIAAMSELEELLADLSAELDGADAMGGEEEMMEPGMEGEEEFGGEEEMGEEEEMMEPEMGGEEELDVDGDGESDLPPKKKMMGKKGKKPFPPK